MYHDYSADQVHTRKFSCVFPGCKSEITVTDFKVVFDDKCDHQYTHHLRQFLPSSVYSAACSVVRLANCVGQILNNEMRDIISSNTTFTMKSLFDIYQSKLLIYG